MQSGLTSIGGAGGVVGVVGGVGGSMQRETRTGKITTELLYVDIVKSPAVVFFQSLHRGFPVGEFPKREYQGFSGIGWDHRMSDAKLLKC